ncbi:IS30 family transposase [Paramicrobacterium fandaimingii]|uniref:IS30 family transposase n=1 Tax=Paramicrobacterium fandaimingii TaxID=2708079 RepID=UPI001FD01916|nr:IS30 family transposase [Microbacterium fandaimingii]
MARRGCKRRLRLEDEFWELIRGGIAPVAAATRVGVGRKTGYRWRTENGGLPPRRLDQEAHSGRYLSLLKRQRIAVLKAQGVSVREVASRLGRAPSTVSRELRRNVSRHDRGGYDAAVAHARAGQRSRRPESGRLMKDPALATVVQEKLNLEWSPEQIAAHLRAAFPDTPSWHICHETMYQGLYHPGRSGLSRVLTRKLRTGRPMRKRRRRAHARTPRFIAPALLIGQRPPAVEDRVRLGDWEGDLSTGRLNKSAIGTLVCRTSRFVQLIHLPDRHDAEALTRAMQTQLIRLPREKRLTLTWDQGSEMASHDRLAHLFSDGVYFAEAASPWQRGSNENTNGLLRQYFPKGSDLGVHSPTELQRVADRLNSRPRKTLNWSTPAELFHDSMP